MFGRNKKVNYGVKKVDKIVTGIIIGSAIASIFGFKHTKKGQEITNNVKKSFFPRMKDIFKKLIGFFGKTIAFIVGIFSKK